MGKVVLAVDGSENSAKAWEYYGTNLIRDDDEVVIVHCTEVPLTAIQRLSLHGSHPKTPHSSDDHSSFHDLMTEAHSSGNAVASKFEEKLKEKKIPYKTLCVFGKPGEYIVKTAAEENATIIVIGTRGLGKVRRTFLGSVSDYVIHHAHCPVLVVRP